MSHNQDHQDAESQEVENPNQNHDQDAESQDTPDKQIRPTVIGVVWRDDEILVQEGYDPEAEEVFYRPFGGGVEFGEHSEEALEREFEEELGVELTGIEYIETYEDVFEFDGETEHEIWRIYEAEIVEDWPYEEDEFTAYEPELDIELQAVWKPVSDFIEGDQVFYPEEYLEEVVMEKPSETEQNNPEDDFIRPVVLGIIWRDDSREELLVSEYRDPDENYEFYRPLGGEIEFGEEADDALEREFEEELGVELTGVEYFETYDRVFEFDGETGHEIQILYEAEIVEDWPYEEDRFEAYEPDLDKDLTVTWKSVKDFVENDEILYPENFIEEVS